MVFAVAPAGALEVPDIVWVCVVWVVDIVGNCVVVVSCGGATVFGVTVLNLLGHVFVVNGIVVVTGL